MPDIVIPTINAGTQFSVLLDALGCQSIRPGTILVLDCDSGDDTVEIAEIYGCKVLSVDKNKFDHGTTRNLAMSEVSSEFVVFLTQDAIPADRNMIAELLKPMQADSNIAICYGRQLPRPGAGPLERFAREFNYPAQSLLKTSKDIEVLGLKTFFCSNSCSAVRCSVFRELGGFKNGVMVNEDMLFAAKAILHGYSVYYSAAAKVYHSHPHSLIQTFQRYFSIGRFFADNRGLLKQAALKQYGGGMMKSGLKTFWQRRMPHYIVALIIEFAVKAFACQLGWYYQVLFYTKRDTH
jgi:rhamnosyltransferase